MSVQDLVSGLRARLTQLYPNAESARSLLEASGLDLSGLDFTDPIQTFWRRALDECQLQGHDALESFLAEVVESHPHIREGEVLLQRLARGELEAPQAEEGGGALAEAVVRDPLEGTDLLIAFAEARGSQPMILIQLRRCRQILLEINSERKMHGRTLVREARWKQTLREIMEMAHLLEEGG